MRFPSCYVYSPTSPFFFAISCRIMPTSILPSSIFYSLKAKTLQPRRCGIKSHPCENPCNGGKYLSMSESCYPVSRSIRHCSSGDKLHPCAILKPTNLRLQI